MHEGESLFPPESERPEFHITINGEYLRLGWDNTLIRRFLVGNGEFNHLVIETSPDEGLFVLFSQLDDTDLIEQLEAANYPFQVNPILDERTIALFARAQTTGLESERF
jgi:hypothetical protein